MGTIYTVIPLDQKCVEWLDAEGVSCPPLSNPSRYPTPREIVDAIGELQNYEFSVHSDSQTKEWTVQVNTAGDAWAQIRVRNFQSEDIPHEFYFTKGWQEVVLAVTRRLARRCGAFVLVDDGGNPPTVVLPIKDADD